MARRRRRTSKRKQSKSLPAALSGLGKAGVLRAMKIPPRVSGVYFLVDKSEVVYVGKSIHVAARVMTHLYENTKRFTAVYFVALAPERLSEVEALFIRGLRPKANLERWIPRTDDLESLRKALRVVTGDELITATPPEPSPLPELVRLGLEDVAAHARSPIRRFLAEVELGRRAMRELPDDFKFWLRKSPKDEC